MFVGPYKWRWSGDWIYEPDECPGEGEFKVAREEWENLDFPMECTECGADLDPFCDHFTAEDGTTSGEIYNRTITAPAFAAEGKQPCS